MANEVFVEEQTALSWKTSGGDAVITLTSLTTNNGRVGAQYDRGASARPARALVRLKTRLGATTTSVTVGNAISVYFATADTALTSSILDGDVGTSDAALSSIEKRRNLQFVGTLEQDKTAAANDLYRGSWIVDLPQRYLSPVVINEIGNTLSATAGDHELTVTYLADQTQ